MVPPPPSAFPQRPDGPPPEALPELPATERRPLATLTGAIARIAAAPHAQGTVLATLEVVREIFAAQAAGIWTLRESTGEMLLSEAAGPGGDGASRLPPLVRLDGDGLIAGVARTRLLLCLCEPEAVARHLSAEGWGAGLASLLCLPLQVGDRLVGAMLVGACRPHAFDAEHVMLATAIAHVAAAALQRAALNGAAERPYAAALRAKARAEALAAVGQAISASLELDEVLALVVERAAAAVGAHGAAVLHRELPGGALRFRRVHGLADRELERFTLPAGLGTAGAALAGGQPVWTEDIVTDPRFRSPGHVLPPIAAEGIRGILSAPIRGRTDPYGVLSLYWRDAHAFASDEIAFVAQIADQAAIAIENARLYEDSQRRAREATALADVGRALTESLDMDRVLTRIVEEVQRVMGASFAGILSLDQETQELAYVKGTGLSPARMARVRLKVGEGIVGRAAAEGRPVSSANILCDPCYIPLGLEEEGFRSMLCSPLLIGGRALGVLAIFRLDERDFPPAEVQLLVRFADQAAVAIENARLFESTRQREEHLRALLGTNKKIGALVPLDTLLASIAEEAARLLGVQGAGFRLLEGDQLVLAGVWGEAREAMRRPRIRRDESLSGWVVTNGRPLVVSDLLEDPRLIEEHRQEARRLGHKAFLGVPLKVGERITGVLTIRAKAQRQFTEMDVQLATAFADQAAIAIENARLYQKERARTQDLAALIRTGWSVASSLDLEQILKSLVTSAVELAGGRLARLQLLEEGHLVLRACAGPLQGEFEQAIGSAPILMGESFSGEVAARGRSLWIPDIAADPREIYGDFNLRHGLRCYLGVPILAADRVLGVLSVLGGTEGGVTEERSEVLGSLAAQAAIAIENARLYAETREALEELAAIHEAGQAIAQSLDLQETLQHILAAAMRLTDTDKGIVTLLDEERQELVGVAFAGVIGHSEMRVPLSEQAFAVACFRAGRVLTTENPENDPRCSPALQARFGNKALIAVPLRSGDRVIGVFDVGDLKRRRQFTARQIAVLERLALQAVVAIENARLYERQRQAARDAERQRAQAEALAAVGQAISASLDLDEVLSILVERTAAATGASAVAVLERETPTGALRFRKAHGLSHRYLEGLAFSSPAGVSGAALAGGRAQGTADVLADPGFAYPVETRARMAAEGIRGLLSVPIRGGGGPYGTLNLYWQDPHLCTEEETTFAARIADQAGLAIENARLYAETREALEELAAIHEAGQAIAQSLDLQQTLQQILAAAMRLTETDKGIIRLVDAERQELVAACVLGHGGDPPASMPLAESSLLATCLRLGRVLIAENPVEEPRAHPELQARYGNQALIAVPLRSGDRVIGVLDLGDLKGQRHFTTRQIAVLERLAQQAVVAIENARLYAEARKAYEDLRGAQEQLVQAEKLKALGEMAAGVAHDFNNLLAAILGRAQLLRMRSADLHVRQDLEVIERAALDGAETVRRILGFARAGSEGQYAPVDLTALIPQVLEVTRPRWRDEAQQRGGAIEAELALEAVPAVRGNAAELREVLVNLVFNAVDAMPQGGRLTVGTRRLWRPGPAGDAVTRHLEVLAEQHEEVRELVEIFVRDTGVGMSEAVRRRAFDPFFTTKGVKGSGLGLSVVYGIVSRHGGEVILESQEGAGTTVAIRLPATTRPPAEAGRPVLTPAPRAARIVVLDDQPVLAEVLADVLRLQRHQVETFTEPRAALAYLARASADLLFTDLGMPEMSGWDVAQEARRVQPGIRVVLVSGWGHHIGPAQVREGRVDAVVAKPYRLDDIIRTVAELLPADPIP